MEERLDVLVFLFVAASAVLSHLLHVVQVGLFHYLHRLLRFDHLVWNGVVDGLSFVDVTGELAFVQVFADLAVLVGVCRPLRELSF